MWREGCPAPRRSTLPPGRPPGDNPSQTVNRPTPGFARAGAGQARAALAERPSRLADDEDAGERGPPAAGHGPVSRGEVDEPAWPSQRHGHCRGPRPRDYHLQRSAPLPVAKDGVKEGGATRSRQGRPRARRSPSAPQTRGVRSGAARHGTGSGRAPPLIVDCCRREEAFRRPEDTPSVAPRGRRPANPETSASPSTFTSCSARLRRVLGARPARSTRESHLA